MLEPCPLETKRDKTFPYDEYYVGKTDYEKRRTSTGENHWKGAESIEWYEGHFTRDTMNGPGEYRWRYRGPESAFVTYEGRFYGNRMHGYGTMSYPDGRTFNGLFYKNHRWGPGIESHACLQADLGFWRGSQLIRLAWRPLAPSVVLDFMNTTTGRAILETYRVILIKASKIIGETNTALELLKQNGADPQVATRIWTKLYPTHCTDLESQACHVDVFQREYYGSKLYSLDEMTRLPDQFETKNEEVTDSDSLESSMYFAWNNSRVMLHMMKHCYKHEKQRKTTRVNLTKILNGSRKHFRPAGKHERDCRTLLMASYLGYITNVAQLINEHNIYPDLSDMQGNTALMYATCGDQADIIHFLVEAGANINYYNDSCCTPLGVALMRYACAKRDIAPKTMVEALLPRSTFVPQNQASEWHICRDLPSATAAVQEPNAVSVTKTASRLVKPMGSRRGTITSVATKQPKEPEYDSDDSLLGEKRLYSAIANEYSIRVNNMFMGPIMVVPYIFSVTNMVQDVQDTGVASPKKPEKGAKNAKAEKKPLKDNNIRPSKEVWSQEHDKEEFVKPETSNEKLKVEMLSKMMLTILQLLADGADPRLVVFPQPALLIALTAGDADLVRHLIRYGVDVNEKYPGALNYSALDVAISRTLTTENLELIRALLENGAETNHRLQFPEGPGPTLLHAVLAKKTEYEFEDEILHQILELLLEYKCNPGTQFNGRSAIDIVMTNKTDYIETFIKSPATHLNEIINGYNQTILVKMLSPTYFKASSEINRSVILSHLLLYGADPLMECLDGEEKYGNIFEYTKKMLDNIEMGVSVKSKHTLDKPAAKSKQNLKNPKSEKGKGEKPKSDKLTAEEISEYKLETVLVTECARFLHIRWLQTKLMRKLLEVIIKYKHRPWNMIMKEDEDRRPVGLWLTPQRCLEIWDILKTTRKKLYKDDRVLRHLLCIVEFYNSIAKLPGSASELRVIITAVQKRSIESKVACLMKDHKIASGLIDEVQAWGDVYVKPELAFKSDSKFNICFECALPLPRNDDDKVICTLCFVVSFCSFKCMHLNTDRINCHPCSEYLKQKYIDLTDPREMDIEPL